MKTRFGGIGGLVAVGAVVVGFGAGCDGMEPGDEAEGVETTSSELTLPKQFTLHNYRTNYCLGVAAGNPNPGSKMVVWHCDGTANQNFQPVANPNGRFTVKNMVGTNRCLDVTRGQYVTYTNGSPVDIGLCDAPTTQAWDLIPAGPDMHGNPCYQFGDQYGPNNVKLVMGVSGGSTAEGAAVIMWENFSNFSTHPDQYWCVY
jgi:hypothetical protein